MSTQTTCCALGQHADWLAACVASTASFYLRARSLSCVIFCAYVNEFLSFRVSLSSLERISLPQVNTLLLSARLGARLGTWLLSFGLCFLLSDLVRRTGLSVCMSLHSCMELVCVRRALLVTCCHTNGKNKRTQPFALSCFGYDIKTPYVPPSRELRETMCFLSKQCVECTSRARGSVEA